jgi:hypothetical protein
MQVEGRLQGKTAPAGWPVFLRKTALSLSCLLLASAGICWVAANWQHATRLQKLAGAQALLVVIVLLAAWAYPRVKPNDHNFSFAACLTGLAGICTGALLALVGQIYQTGADSWELFLLWAVLLLPWLLATHTVFLALLFAVLLNVSLALYLYMWIGSLDGWGWLAVLDPQASALLLGSRHRPSGRPLAHRPAPAAGGGGGLAGGGDAGKRPGWRRRHHDGAGRRSGHGGLLYRLHTLARRPGGGIAGDGGRFRAHCRSPGV